MPDVVAFLNQFHLVTCFEAALVVTLLLRGAWRSWPSLLTYGLVDLLTDAVLEAAIRNRSTALYVWTYWIWHLVAAAMRVWVLNDVLRALPGAGFIVKYLRTATVILGTILTLAVWAFCSRELQGPSNRYLNTSVTLDASVLLAWAAFVLSSLITLKGSGVRWSITGVLVMAGVVTRSQAGIIAAYFLTHSPSRQALAVRTQCIASLIAFLLWTASTIVPDPWRARSQNAPPKVR